jgi:hypothetical protein
MGFMASSCSTDPNLTYCVEGFSSFHLILSDSLWPSLEQIADECNVPYFKWEHFLAVADSHPVKWSPETVAVFLTLQGSFAMHISDATNPFLGALFYNADYDGISFMHLAADDLVQIGITAGSAAKFIRGKAEWLGSYGKSPSEVLNADNTYSNANATNISLTLMLEKLLGVNEVDGTFEVELMVIISWADDRIFSQCASAGVDGKFAEGDPCALFWTPTLVWHNLKLDAHTPRLAPTIVEDFGFTSVVGQRVRDNMVGDPPSALLNTSIGQSMYRVRGTFMSDFEFHDFPYDHQHLEVEISLEGSLPVRLATLTPHASKVPVVEGGGDLPLWKTVCIEAESHEHDLSGVSEDWMKTAGDPYAAYWRDVFVSGPEVLAVEMARQTPGGDYMTMEEMGEYQRWSRATLRITVQRLPFFYNYNFVLVMVLLVLVSFFSFLLPPSSLDSRLGLTLTVILGINVFQIVIIDNVPATGYLTRMHQFCLFSTILVVMVAVENVIVYSCSRRVGNIYKVLESLKGKGVAKGAKGAWGKVSAKVAAGGPDNENGPDHDLSQREGNTSSIEGFYMWVDKSGDHLALFVFPIVFAVIFATSLGMANEEYVCSS